jgi:general secretion pathway protein F
VPVFAQMAGDNPDLPLISKVVFRAGALAQTQFVPIAIALGLIVMGIVLAVANPKVRAGAYRLIHRAPILGGILKAREIAGWARLIGFALKSGVLLLDAAALARQGAPDGPFRDGLQTFERDLKAGVDVDVSLGRHTRLEAMDLALLRAGQKSGQLPRMFLYVAERYDALLKDRLRRVTAMVEPATIGVVALFVALLAVSIMLSLTSVYESIS